jgi:hypothetical protein
LILEQFTDSKKYDNEPKKDRNKKNILKE